MNTQMNTQMNNDTVVLQQKCSVCEFYAGDKTGNIYLTKDTNTEYCLDCFRENACGECYNAEECTCKQEDSEDEEEDSEDEEEDSEDEEEKKKEAQRLYRANLLKEATESGLIDEIIEERRADYELKMKQEEDSEDEEEEEQIYCDHCSNQTNAETATECGWVGDEETGEWKCVMCVLIEKTLEEKRHAEIHNASFAKWECCTWCLKFPDYTKRPKK